MSTEFKYMPIFRSRREEDNVLKSFKFGDRIFPCVEIIKETTRNMPDEEDEIADIQRKKKYDFANDYLRLLSRISAKKIFVDIPIHFKTTRNTKPETLKFLLGMGRDRERRTLYLKKLNLLNRRIIPVISSYFNQTQELNSILKQEKELRGDFASLAFRTLIDDFIADIVQIKAAFKPGDYLIIDWGDSELDLAYGTRPEIMRHLNAFVGSIVIHRNPISKDVTNKSFKDGEIIDAVDNRLINKYKEFYANSFSDYAGIKKDAIEKGPPISSPGFPFYDAVENEFYGFRFKYGSHKKGEVQPNPSEFETTIVPAIIDSGASHRMREHQLDFLGENNTGWTTIVNIRNGEAGRSPAKFKKIGMLHYLHCIKTKMQNGDFD